MARVFVVGDQGAEVEGATALLEIGYGGKYFFLYPMIRQLQQDTGELIDPQHDAFFAGDALDALRRFVREARALALRQPPEWSQRVGESLASAPVSEVTSRSDVLSILQDLEAATDSAASAGLGVWFVGE